MGKAIGTPSRTRQLLGEAEVKLKKGLGQNFLVEPQFLQRIAHAAMLDGQTAVLEVGPGIGSLTECLAQQAGKVVAVEIDERLIPLLQKSLAIYPHVEVVQGDVLKLDLEHLEREQFSPFSRWGVVSNLPYYITTPIISRFLLSSLHYDFMVVMMQKEVAERMRAEPGGKEYGSLSILVQYFCCVEEVCDVPPQAFYPPPKVVSQVLRLQRRQRPPVDVSSPSFFFDLVRAAFAQRRKTLLNNLLTKYQSLSREGLSTAIEGVGVDPNRRGETLSLQEFARISNRLEVLLREIAAP